MKFAAWFAVAVGALVIAQWSIFLATGHVPELQTEPLRLGFHLAAELAMAGALLIAGWASLTRRPWGRAGLQVALGMLLYTVIVSPGYFAQRGQWPLVGMFALLLALALAAVVRVAQFER